MLEIKNRHICHQDIPTIHNGYCISKPVDYATKNEVSCFKASLLAISPTKNNCYVAFVTSSV